MTSPVMTPADLREALAGPTPPLLLDVRWTLAGPERAAYEAGHLPGAVFVDLDTDLSGPPGPGGRHPLPDAAAFTATMRRLGVGPDRAVVAYDAASSTASARAWWCLRWFGHADVRVLDGGLAAWVAAGGPLEQGDVDPVPAPSARAVPGGMPVLDADGAAQVARSGVLLDARSGARFRGEREPVDPVAGRIPGARHLDVRQVLGEGGALLPPGTVRSLLADASEGQDGPVGAYCGSGVSAAQLVLAAATADVDVALYVGSWSDWLTDPSRPVARGA